MTPPTSPKGRLKKIHLRYFFHIGYHGTKYRGWQKHPDSIGVQDVLETTLSKVLKYPVHIISCGRTDALVHAAQFFFHVDIEEQWDFDLLFRLNKTLPDDIAIFDIIPMEGSPHCRFDAVHRSYDYFMHTYKDPFLSGFSSFYAEKKLNLSTMNAACDLLPKYNDYRAFCVMPDRIDHTICNVRSARFFTHQSGDRLRFQISANRFLSKMVRIIIGRLLEIGKGEMSVDEFEHYLANKITPKVIIPAYPQGLYLSKVTYPYLDMPVRSEFLGMLRDGDWSPL